MSTEQTVPLAPPTAPFDVAETSPLVETPAAPRIRWAGIIWGLVFAALAVGALVTLSSAASVASIRDGILAFDPSTVNPAAVVAVVAIGVGVVLLIVGGITLLRRAQQRSGA